LRPPRTTQCRAPRKLRYELRARTIHWPSAGSRDEANRPAISRDEAVRGIIGRGLIPVPAGPPLTILIADDHAVVRQGLRSLLETEEDLSVVGEATDVDETRTLLRERRPAVLVLD